MKLITPMTLAVIFVATAQTASAAPIFDQLAITTPNFLPYSDAAGNQQFSNGLTAADDFVLGSAETIRSIEFHGAYFDGDGIATDSFTVLAFSDVSGAPSDTPLLTSTLTNLTRTGTGFFDFGPERYNYLADLTSPMSLSVGTYWLAILNDTPGDSDIWGWTDTGASGNIFQDRNASAPFLWSEGDIGQEASFRLDNAVISDSTPPTGAVPEPATASLLGLGLAGLALRARRRRGSPA